MYKNINKTGRVRRIKKKQRRLQRRISRKYRLNKKGEKFQKTRNIIKSEKKLLKIVHRLTNIRCPICGLVLDRDINTIYNLYQYGQLAVNQ